MIPLIFYESHTKTDSDVETERITEISGLNFFVRMAHKICLSSLAKKLIYIL